MNSDGIVLAIWIGSAAVIFLACLLFKGSPDWSRLRFLLGDEAGSSHALGYALGLPIFGMILLLFVETTLLLVGKVGTMYAAHAGARSAVVWSSARPESIREAKIQDAICYAMAPFASGNAIIAGQLPSRPGAEADLYDAYSRYAVNPVLSRGYIAAKARTAYALTRYRVTYSPSTSRSSVLMTEVRFDAPLHSRIIGAALGRRESGRSFYTRTITSSVTMPEDRGRAADGGVGIDYHSH